MNPLLTIIIPTFNSSKTIRTAIDSITNQSFKNFDVLVIDAVSTDGTVEIISAYQKNNSQIKFISENDKGIYDAMNKGIKMAKGQWLYFLGSDDRLYSNETLSIIFESQAILDEDVVYGNVIGTVFNGVYGSEFTQEKFMEDNICHQAIFFRRTIFDTVGFFNLRYKSYADWDHNIKWFLSDKINKRYLDVIIAEYADGGFSAQNFDYDFLRIKNLNYLEYGRKVLRIGTKLKILKAEMIRAFQSRDKKMIWEIVRRTPYILP